MIVVAATVTYGHRGAMCVDVARRALACGADRVIVVDNGLSDESRRIIEEFDGENPATVRLMTIERPTGSAGGFRAALEAASQIDGADSVWLLDDDNLPDLDALSRLVRQLSLGHSVVKRAVVACRDSDENHQRLKRGVQHAYARPGSFMGFDVFSQFHKSSVDGTRLPSRCEASVPEAPYGGLLLPLELVRSNDLPREDFVLYFDDVEYSRRLIASGISISVVLDANVRELVPKWTDGTESFVAGMVGSSDNRKTFYTLRNCAYLDARRGSKLKFGLNLAIYTTYSILTALKHGRFQFIPLYVRSVVAGLRGRLGERA